MLLPCDVDLDKGDVLRVRVLPLAVRALWAALGFARLSL
jgi:hypothetical protein